MTTLMMPMRKAQDVLYQFCTCLAMEAMDTQLTTVMVPLTAGLVASLIGFLYGDALRRIRAL